MDIKIYDAGHNKMVETDKGHYIELSDFYKFLDWLTDDDDPQVVLNKIDQVRNKIDKRRENV